MRARDERSQERPGVGDGPGRLCTATALMVALVVVGFAGAPAPARADEPDADSPFAFDAYEKRYGVLPTHLLYNETHESKPPSVSFRRNELRAVEAPTRYRTSSILKYTTPLGDTGMELRVRLPLKREKIVKVELRF